MQIARQPSALTEHQSGFSQTGQGTRRETRRSSGKRTVDIASPALPLALSAFQILQEVFTFEEDAPAAPHEADSALSSKLKQTVSAERLARGAEDHSRVGLIVESSVFHLIEIHAVSLPLY
jgi:hypothetical protein